MPGDKFKPQYKRLLFIDQKIRGGKYPSCASMAAEWEVSAKTIQRDVDYLKYELNAPIEYDPARHGLFYADKTWFLPAVLLSEGDILALIVGSQALELYKGTPVAQELKSIYARLTQILPDKISIAPELMFNRFSFHGVPVRPISADIWKALIRGVLNQRAMRIEYASPQSREPKAHVVHPLHMVNLEGDWYVLAYETRWKDVAQFAISRIKKADIQDETFTAPKGFDVERLLKDRFGKFIHTGGKKRTVVRLLFSPQVAGSIAERTWHPKQRLKWRRDGRLELVFPVVDVRDVVPWVLSYGGHVDGIAPKALRDEVVAAAKRLVKSHSA